MLEADDEVTGHISRRDDGSCQFELPNPLQWSRTDRVVDLVCAQDSGFYARRNAGWKSFCLERNGPAFAHCLPCTVHETSPLTVIISPQSAAGIFYVRLNCSGVFLNRGRF